MWTGSEEELNEFLKYINKVHAAEHLKIGDSFTSKRTRKRYSVNFYLNCNSTNVVCLLSCRLCGI